MTNETKETILRLINKELFSVINNETMLEWAKNMYLKELINAKNEIGE
jgi:hypothetical protein